MLLCLEEQVDEISTCGLWLRQL